MKILSIDSGLARIGYAAFEIIKNHPHYLFSGLIQTSAKLPLANRIEEIYTRFEKLLAGENFSYVFFEQLFFNQNVTNAIAVAQSQGAMIVAAQKTLANVQFLTPLFVKQTIAGYGRADKKQMLHMVKLLLPGQVNSQQDDEIDAIAIGLTGARMLKLPQL